MITILTIILMIGTWQVEEYAVAKNVTLVPTYDNHVRFNSVIYSDKECSVANHVDQYAFNSAELAFNYWNVHYPSFVVPRYEQRWHITDNTCWALKAYDFSFILITGIMGILGLFVDTAFYCYIYRRCRTVRIKSIDNPALGIPVSLRKRRMNSYATSLIADASVRNGATFQLSLEPLDKTTVDSNCGSRQTSARAPVVRQTPLRCVACRGQAIYTCVHAKLAPIKEEANEDREYPQTP